MPCCRLTVQRSRSSCGATTVGYWEIATYLPPNPAEILPQRSPPWSRHGRPNSGRRWFPRPSSIAHRLPSTCCLRHGRRRARLSRTQSRRHQNCLHHRQNYRHHHHACCHHLHRLLPHRRQCSTLALGLALRGHHRLRRHWPCRDRALRPVGAWVGERRLQWTGCAHHPSAWATRVGREPNFMLDRAFAPAKGVFASTCTPRRSWPLPSRLGRAIRTISATSV